MNGADIVIETLVAHGIDTCFMNPGTSEMHVVAALDRHVAMRGVLTLFEGVASGAADGFGRMAERPAATLLHLGPGLANALANLHNARRANTPLVNIVGDHATAHKAFDPPLNSDITTVAHNTSKLCVVASSVETVGSDLEYVISSASAPPGQIATLILPADVAWSETTDSHHASRQADTFHEIGISTATDDQIHEAAAALASEAPTAILLGGMALRRNPLTAAGQISVACGAKLFAETFPARLERGAGIVSVERLSYLSEFVSLQLAGFDHLIVIGARPPVSFFAYPETNGSPIPEGCNVIQLTGPASDPTEILLQLADEMHASKHLIDVAEHHRPPIPSGSLTAETLSLVIGALLPEDAIIIDEAQTSGIFASAATSGAPPHDWLTLTGGAIGMGLPLAVGASVACPGRRVLTLEADGSAMYTIQALWTQAREGLDITTVILNNGSYAILEMELGRLGITDPGPRAKAMTDLSRPPIKFVDLAKGLGVPAALASTIDEFRRLLEESFNTSGPMLIDARIPSIF